MQAHARSVLPPAIAALAVSLSVFAFSPLNSAANAAECLTAPKGAAPQGSHWYYRLERGSQRKCWRLVQKDQKGQGTAAQAAAQGDVDDDTDDTPAPQIAKKSGGRAAAPQSKASQAALVTRNVSDSENASDTEKSGNATAAAQPVQWPDPPASMMERPEDPAPVAPAQTAPTETIPAQTAGDAPAPAAVAQQPDQQPLVTADGVAPAPAPGGATASSSTSAASGGTSTTSGGTSSLQFIFAVIAFVGLVACPIFYLAGVRLRRSDVLNKAQHLNALPAEVPASPRAPTFQPLPPMDLMPRQHDDVEEAMQRFAERWKRRAA
jgi:hypothetical protein